MTRYGSHLITIARNATDLNRTSFVGSGADGLVNVDFATGVNDAAPAWFDWGEIEALALAIVASDNVVVITQEAGDTWDLGDFGGETNGTETLVVFLGTADVVLTGNATFGPSILAPFAGVVVQGGSLPSVDGFIVALSYDDNGDNNDLVLQGNGYDLEYICPSTSRPPSSLPTSTFAPSSSPAPTTSKLPTVTPSPTITKAPTLTRSPSADDRCTRDSVFADLVAELREYALVVRDDAALGAGSTGEPIAVGGTLTRYGSHLITIARNATDLNRTSFVGNGADGLVNVDFATGVNDAAPAWFDWGEIEALALAIVASDNVVVITQEAGDTWDLGDFGGETNGTETLVVFLGTADVVLTGNATFGPSILAPFAGVVVQGGSLPSVDGFIVALSYDDNGDNSDLVLQGNGYDLEYICPSTSRPPSSLPTSTFAPSSSPAPTTSKLPTVTPSPTITKAPTLTRSPSADDRCTRDSVFADLVAELREYALVVRDDAALGAGSTGEPIAVGGTLTRYGSHLITIARNATDLNRTSFVGSGADGLVNVDFATGVNDAAPAWFDWGEIEALALAIVASDNVVVITQEAGDTWDLGDFGGETNGTETLVVFLGTADVVLTGNATFGPSILAPFAGVVVQGGSLPSVDGFIVALSYDDNGDNNDLVLQGNGYDLEYICPSTSRPPSSLPTSTFAPSSSPAPTTSKLPTVTPSPTITKAPTLTRSPSADDRCTRDSVFADLVAELREYALVVRDDAALGAGSTGEPIAVGGTLTRYGSHLITIARNATDLNRTSFVGNGADGLVNVDFATGVNDAAPAWFDWGEIEALALAIVASDNVVVITQEAGDTWDLGDFGGETNGTETLVVFLGTADVVLTGNATFGPSILAPFAGVVVQGGSLPSVDGFIVALSYDDNGDNSDLVLQGNGYDLEYICPSTSRPPSSLPTSTFAPSSSPAPTTSKLPTVTPSPTITKAPTLTRSPSADDRCTRDSVFADLVAELREYALVVRDDAALGAGSTGEPIAVGGTLTRYGSHLITIARNATDLNRTSFVGNGADGLVNVDFATGVNDAAPAWFDWGEIEALALAIVASDNVVVITQEAGDTWDLGDFGGETNGTETLVVFLGTADVVLTGNATFGPSILAPFAGVVVQGGSLPSVDGFIVALSYDDNGDNSDLVLQGNGYDLEYICPSTSRPPSSLPTSTFAPSSSPAPTTSKLPTVTPSPTITKAPTLTRSPSADDRCTRDSVFADLVAELREYALVVRDDAALGAGSTGEPIAVGGTLTRYGSHLITIARNATDLNRTSFVGSGADGLVNVDFATGVNDAAPAWFDWGEIEALALAIVASDNVVVITQEAGDTWDLGDFGGETNGTETLVVFLGTADVVLTGNATFGPSILAPFAGVVVQGGSLPSVDGFIVALSYDDNGDNNDLVLQGNGYDLEYICPSTSRPPSSLPTSTFAPSSSPAPTTSKLPTVTPSPTITKAPTLTRSPFSRRQVHERLGLRGSCRGTARVRSRRSRRRCARRRIDRGTDRGRRHAD